MAATTGISAREGYERWAPSYPQVPGNPLMRAEQRLMLEHWPAVAGRRALDLACGSGRYVQLLRAAGAAQVIALDASPGMLQRVAWCRTGLRQHVAPALCGRRLRRRHLRPGPRA